MATASTSMGFARYASVPVISPLGLTPYAIPLSPESLTVQ